MLGRKSILRQTSKQLQRGNEKNNLPWTFYSACHWLARTDRFGPWMTETGKKLIVMMEVWGFSSFSCASLAWWFQPPEKTVQISCEGKGERPRPSGLDMMGLCDDSGKHQIRQFEHIKHKHIQMWQWSGWVLPSQHHLNSLFWSLTVGRLEVGQLTLGLHKSRRFVMYTVASLFDLI